MPEQPNLITMQRGSKMGTIFMDEVRDSKYRVAEEVYEVAAKLITNVHDHLAEAKIVYLFRDDEWKSKGKIVLGKAYKVPEQWSYLSGYDLLVVINERAWSVLSDRQKTALIDHELCHFEKDIDESGNPKWRMVNHDVEEFTGVVRRHGLWSPDVENFFSEAQQLRLFDGSVKVVAK